MKLKEKEKLYGNNYQLRYEELLKQYDKDTHILQNQLDLANARIIELQKENEVLQSIKYANVNYLDIEKIKTEECKRWQDKIRAKIDNRIATVENLLDEMVDKNTGCINTSYLSKKEKEEVIAKRNCLIVQKATLIDMKNDLLKEE